jgi:uncharacterized membrane protein
MVSVTLYSRQDCQLCAQAEADLAALQATLPHSLNVVDVESTAELRKAYGFEVPVVEVGPYRLKAPFSRDDLQIALQAANLGVEQEEKISRDIDSGAIKIPVKWTRADQFTYWLSKHYMLLFNLLVFLYVGLPFLAPVLMKLGATGPAWWIYRGYNVVCHQFAFRSWFLFGEQPAYPREEAGMKGWIPYEAIVQNVGPEDYSDRTLWEARWYIGDAQVGYKVALCERDIAIYGAIFLFGVVFALFGRKWKALPVYLWLLVGVAPIALDGGSQLIATYISRFQIAIDFARESTPLLRTLTGALFGLTTAWFGYPLVEESMRESRDFLEAKEKRVERQTKDTPEG